jgi:hypothetical protein
MWRGSIRAEGPTERQLLQTFGVRVGYWSAQYSEFRDCTMPTDVLVKLQPHYGRFVWDLDEVSDHFPCRPVRRPSKEPPSWRRKLR